MNEDFVSFSIAKKLKEKGFRKKCFARYIENYLDLDCYRPNIELFDCYNEDPDLGRFYIDAPTISQVLKWLREEKKMHICIIVYEYTWGYTVYDLDTFFPEEFSSYYNTYEEAALAGIKYVIDNLI